MCIRVRRGNRSSLCIGVRGRGRRGDCGAVDHGDGGADLDGVGSGGVVDCGAECGEGFGGYGFSLIFEQDGLAFSGFAKSGAEFVVVQPVAYGVAVDSGCAGSHYGSGSIHYVGQDVELIGG